MILYYGNGFKDLKDDGDINYNKYLQKWIHMICRCYSDKFLEKHPSYVGCSVCKEWLYFSNFKKWMETQDWYNNKQLDKDLLIPGNKIYSPETCLFVDSKVNMFIIEPNKNSNNLPIGVSARGSKYRAQISVKNKMEKLGTFDTANEAHEAWRKRKYELATQLAEEQTDPRVAMALLDRYENYVA